MGSLRSLHLNHHKYFRETLPPTDLEFISACKTGNIHVVQQMLRDGANVNARTALGLTPLMLAAFNRFMDIVILLIDHGADVNLLTYRHEGSAWFYSLGNKEITEILLDHGAKPHHYKGQ